MCVDYADLNRACSKDHYSLSSINQLVDLIARHTVVFLVDAISRYHQIRMDPENEEKTAFLTYSRVFYYRAMPFGLKNARTTYQRLVDQMFKEQKGRTVEVYIDDMIIKSKRMEVKERKHEKHKFILLNSKIFTQGHMHHA